MKRIFIFYGADFDTVLTFETEENAKNAYDLFNRMCKENYSYKLVN